MPKPQFAVVDPTAPRADRAYDPADSTKAERSAGVGAGSISPPKPTEGRPGRRRFRWGLVLLGLVAVGLIAWLALGHKKAAAPTRAAAVSVTVAKAAAKDVPITIGSIGSAQAWEAVLVKAQVAGRLLRVPVMEGTEVKAGELIAEIDPAPYQATLMQAQGALKRDQALLANSRLDLARDQTLLAEESIARQVADTQAALVKQQEGTVQVDEGTVAAAQVNVNYTRVTAPVSGRVGVRLTDPGNVVSANDTTGILTIDQITPIAVTFTVPEADFARLSAASESFSKPLAVQAFAQESGELLGSGPLRVADNHVDAATGTVQLKARFENADHKLWPGQLLDVKLTLTTLSQALTIPAQAVNQGPNGTFAYVVGPDNKAKVTPVKVAATQDGVAVIQSGIKAGDTVVTDGQLSLKPGSTVRARAPTGPGGGAGGGGGRGGRGGGKAKAAS